jgi:hypothetical protein
MIAPQELAGAEVQGHLLWPRLGTINLQLACAIRRSEYVSTRSLGLHVSLRDRREANKPQHRVRSFGALVRLSTFASEVSNLRA